MIPAVTFLVTATSAKIRACSCPRAGTQAHVGMHARGFVPQQLTVQTSLAVVSPAEPEIVSRSRFDRGVPTRAVLAQTSPLVTTKVDPSEPGLQGGSLTASISLPVGRPVPHGGAHEWRSGRPTMAVTMEIVPAWTGRLHDHVAIAQHRYAIAEGEHIRPDDD